MIISFLFVIFLLYGAVSNASYSSDNDDFYNDFEGMCTDSDFNQYDAVEDVCNDIKRVRDFQAATAVSYGILFTIKIYIYSLLKPYVIETKCAI